MENAHDRPVPCDHDRSGLRVPFPGFVRHCRGRASSFYMAVFPGLSGDPGLLAMCDRHRLHVLPPGVLEISSDEWLVLSVMEG